MKDDMTISRRRFIEMGAATMTAAGVGCGVTCAFAAESEKSGTAVGSASQSAMASGSASGNTSGSGTAPDSDSNVASTAVRDAIADNATWRVAPDPIADSDVSDTVTADVVIIGYGHAGTAATRAAAEAGASVITIETQEEESFAINGNDIGHINSKYLASQGVPEVDEQEFFENWMLNAGQRANAQLAMKFAKQSGEAFDWLIEPWSDEEIASMNVCFWPETDHTLHELNTGLKYWIGTPQLYGEADGAAFDMTAAYKVIHDYIKANLPSVDVRYGNTAEQLVMDGDKVVGVIASLGDGSYEKYLANKGVILAAGDFSSNMEMCEDLLKPQLECLEGDEVESMQGIGRDGRGIQLGLWAGGRLEPLPIPIMGDFEASVPSKYAALWLDQDGKRYMNECAGDYVNTGFANVRHKHGTRYIVFDSTIIDALTYNVPAHAAYNPTTDGALEQFQSNLDAAYAAGADGYVPTDDHGGNPIYGADDLETLVGYLGLEGAAKDNFLASIDGYNTICASGIDTDFGKDPRLLFPVSKPPYYTVVSSTGRLGFMLVTNGGLETNGDQQVLNEMREPIEGLYATGNCCGMRFGPAYFTPIAGVSLGIAITLGRDVGNVVAAL